jgi:hypothetical protein
MVQTKGHNASNSYLLGEYINKNYVEVYIFIYNGLNEGSFYQVGPYLQVVSCMRIGFLTSQLDMRSTNWDLL